MNDYAVALIGCLLLCDDLVIGNLWSSVVDGLNVIKNYDVCLRCDIGFRYVDGFNAIENLSEWPSS